jgi:hypothetical protein
MTFNKELYNETEASTGFAKIEPGIYVCKILDVEDREQPQNLKIKFDISSGKFKDYYQGEEKAFGDYPSDGFAYRSYKDTAMSFFKGFITAIEKSNANYNFKTAHYDFRTLVGKLFVAVIEREEIPFADDEGKPIVKCRLTKIHSKKHFDEGTLKFSTEIKKLSDKDLEKFNAENEKAAYTDKIVAERTEIAPTPSDDDAPF